MTASAESLATAGAEEFWPDQDCSTDETVGGDPGGQCALVPEEQCTLRCHIRHQEGEAQLNDSLIETTKGPAT